MNKQHSTWARSVAEFYVHTDPADAYHAIVEVTRRMHDEQGNYAYAKHVYRIKWYNFGLCQLQQWAGAQVFGAKRGYIDIRQNAYLGSWQQAVFYNIYRLRRKDTKGHRLNG